MAIQQMQVVGPRSEPREPKEKKKDWIDKVLEGLQIAKGITGITEDYQSIQNTRETRDQRQRLAEAKLKPGEANTQYFDKGAARVGPGEAADVTYTDADSGEAVGIRLPKKKEPELAIKPPETRNFADGTTRQWDPATKTWNVVAKSSPKASGGGTGGPGGKNVSGEVAQNIGKYDAAMTQIDSLEKDWLAKASGSLSGVAQYLPGTDAAQYVDAQKLSAQNIGQIIEGGKLTDTDFDRYLSMMPTAGDSEERAAEKFKRLREYVAERKTSSVDGARQAGYNVSGFTPPVVAEGKLKGPTSGKAFAAPSSPPRALSKGTVEDGFEFLGGDPADKKNWKKVAK